MYYTDNMMNKTILTFVSYVSELTYLMQIM